MTLPEARVVSEGLSSIFTESTKSTFVRNRPQAAGQNLPLLLPFVRMVFAVSSTMRERSVLSSHMLTGGALHNYLATSAQTTIKRRQLWQQ